MSAHVFGFIRTYIWQNDCMTSPAVFSHQTTNGRRRGPSIRWRQRERCGLMRHTPPPPTGCGLFLLSLLRHDWCMTNRFTQAPSRTGKHTVYLHAHTQNTSWSTESSSPNLGVFRAAEAQQTCNTVNYVSEIYFLTMRNICMVCII